MKVYLMLIVIFAMMISGVSAHAQGDLSSVMRGESAIPESPTSARYFDLTGEPIIKPAGPDYRLGPGDILTINLGNITADEIQQQVSSNGNLMFPTLGKVHVEGLTISEAEAALNDACSRYLRNYDVRIQINQVRKIEVQLTGQIHKPGTYLCYAGTTLSQFMQLTERLVFSDPSIAGYGEKQFYNRTNPLFTQVLPEGSVRRAEIRRGEETITVDLADIMVKGLIDNDEGLLHNDNIHIPVVEKSIVVRGGVNPGRYEILPDDNLEDIIQIAGGSYSMNLSEIVAVESVDNYFRNARTVNRVSGTYEDDSSEFSLQDNMIVRIPQMHEFVYLMGAVPHPGTQDFVDGDTLMDYIGRAGGFTRGEQSANTRIIRRKGFGEEREVFEVDLKKVMKSENVGDIRIYPGDIIFVPVKNEPWAPATAVNTIINVGMLLERIFGGGD